jgi:hypothetical protein
MGTMPEAMHLPAALQGLASNVLHGVPKPVMYKEIIGVLEDRFGASTLSQHTVVN